LLEPPGYTNTTLAVNFLQSGMRALTGPGGYISCGGVGALPPGDCVQVIGFQLGSEYSARAAIRSCACTPTTARCCWM
jgi:hypothetical protein